MNEEILNQIEENIEEIPEEVRDFIFGSNLKDIFNEIAKLVTIEQKNHLEVSVKMFLLGAIPIEDIIYYIDSLKLSKDADFQIKTILQEKVLDEVRLIMETHEELEKNKDTSVNKIEAPSPKDMVDRLSQTLKQPATIAPVRRDYSLEKNDVISTSKQSTEPVKKALDPYRELPQ